MTENKAIDEIIKEVCSGCYGSDEEPHRCSTCGFKVAKDALKEIQTYRALGTVDEFKALKEKSVAKKPISNNGWCECPNCNTQPYDDYADDKKPMYCDICGQKLDWE